MTNGSKTAPRDLDAARADSTKRRALGKGLESLLNSRAFAESAAKSPAIARAVAAAGAASKSTEQNAEPISSVAAAEAGGTPLEIALDKLDANPYQTRKRVDEQQLAELSRSIEVNGVVQPIIVRPLPNGRYQLIAGERRWRASKMANKATVPAILRQVSDAQAMEMTIVENLQRADLNPMEQARAYDRLGREFQMTQEQIALRTGKERTSVANFLRLLKLPREVQDKVETGELSYGHARSLLALDSAEAMLKVAARIAAQALSVRQTENYIQGALNPERRTGDEEKAKQPQDANVRAIQEHLQRELGLKVRIEDKKGKGRVVIHYSRIEDFDSLMRAWGGKY